jgi:hypothetical protein
MRKMIFAPIPNGFTGPRVKTIQVSNCSEKLTSTRKRKSGKGMALLPYDAWVLIGLHLKPRHLFKLLVTSKGVNQLVDNNGYWTRVAAHQVWRDFDGMEIDEAPGHSDVLPRIEHNLAHMIGLDHGYFWSMNRFIQRIEEVIDYYSENDDLEAMRGLWVRLKSMSLEEKTRVWWIERARLAEGILMLTTEPGALQRERPNSMKGIAEEETEDSTKNSDPRFNRFVAEMEDDPMPLQFKRHFFRKLDHLLWSSIRRPQGDSTGRLQWGCCHAALAIGICKF